MIAYDFGIMHGCSGCEVWMNILNSWILMSSTKTVAKYVLPIAFSLLVIIIISADGLTNLILLQKMTIIIISWYQCIQAINTCNGCTTAMFDKW